MTRSLFSVKDNLANTFFSPVMLENDEIAKRQFKSQVNSIQVWKDNPSDFELWYLGTFDDETGELWYHPDKICNGRSVLNI